MKLIIEDDEGRKTVVPFVREEITIGRQEGNTIRLTERNVSRRHARLLRQNGHVVVEDLGSYNGIKINGERIQGQTPVNDGDLIQIGDYDLAIHTETAASTAATIQMTTGQQVGNGAVPPSNPRAPAHAPQPVAITPVHPQEVPTEMVESAQPPESQATGHQSEPRRVLSTAVIRRDQVENAPRRQVVDIDAAEAPRLFILNTELAGREFALVRTEIRIGRTEDNDVAVDHRSLSRLHAKVVREDTGEWRILDMESANGVSVNGERYAQVSLRSGDEIDLGHVKMKFLAPGETFRFVPGRYDGSATDGRGKLLVAAGVVTLVLALGIAAWVVLDGDDQVPEGGTDQPEVQPPPTPPPPAPPAPSVDVDSRLKAARKAMDEQDFDRVLEILEPIKNPDGTRPELVEDLRRNASDEKENQRKLALVTKELNAGASANLDLAQRLLTETQGTLSFAVEWKQAKARLEKARKKAPGSGKSDPPAPVAAPRNDEAQKRYQDGRLLFKKRQFKEAQVFFTKCLDLEPKNADCHLALGSTYAKLRDPEKGAEHYRKFLELAPTHQRAEEVENLLKAYEDHRSKQK